MEKKKVFDPEISQSNPVEDRFMRMHRVQIGLDASVKLTNNERKDLARIVDYSTTKQLSDADKNKVWMSRLYLRSIVAALPKFLVRQFLVVFGVGKKRSRVFEKPVECGLVFGQSCSGSDQVDEGRMGSSHN
jgi:hypothetical protein